MQDTCGLAGHAGSRIGWALVGDKAVADLMRDYLQLHGGVPAESQARAANDLEFVLSTRGGGWGAGTHSAALPMSVRPGGWVPAMAG